jgi:hypothetical protein
LLGALLLLSGIFAVGGLVVAGILPEWTIGAGSALWVALLVYAIFANTHR